MPTIFKPSWIRHEGASVYAVDVHPDGSKLATGGADNRAHIWPLSPVLSASSQTTNGKSTLKPLCSISGHEQSVNVVRWSPNGRWLATGSSDGRVGLAERTANPTEFGAAAGSEVWRLRQYLAGSKMEIWDIAWSPDSSKIAGCCHDQNVYVWDIAAGGQLLTILKGHSSVVKGIVWDPIGTFLATQDDTSMIVWKVDGWKLEKQITEPFSRSHATSTFRRPSWTPDGSILIGAAAMVAGSHAPLLIEREKWQYSHFPVGHRSFIGATAANPCIFVGSNGAFLCYALADVNQLLTVWTTQQEHALAAIARGVDKPVTDLRWSPDGSLLIAASLDGTVLVVHFEEGELGISMSDTEKEGRLRQTYGTTSGALFEDPALLALYQERKQRQEEANAQIRSQQLALQQQQSANAIPGKQTETIVKGRRKIVPVLVSGPESSLPTTSDPTDAFRNVFATGNLKPSDNGTGASAPPPVPEAKTSNASATITSAPTGASTTASTPSKSSAIQNRPSVAPTASPVPYGAAKSVNTPPRISSKATPVLDAATGGLFDSGEPAPLHAPAATPGTHEKKRGRPMAQSASGTLTAAIAIDLENDDDRNSSTIPPAKRPAPSHLASAPTHASGSIPTTSTALLATHNANSQQGQPQNGRPLPLPIVLPPNSPPASNVAPHSTFGMQLRSPPQASPAHGASGNLAQSGSLSATTGFPPTSTHAANSSSPGPAGGSLISQIANAKKVGRPRGRKAKQVAATQALMDVDDDLADDTVERGTLGGPRLLLPLPFVEKRFSARIAPRSDANGASASSLFLAPSVEGADDGQSNTAMLEVLITIDEDGFRPPKSSLKYMEGKVTMWQDQLEDKVTAMAGNASHVMAVGCVSGDLYLYSASGRRTFPTINVSSYPICALEVDGSTLLAVTCDGKLRVWDVALGIAKADTDLHTLMAKHYTLQLERGSTEPVLNNRPVADLNAEDGSVVLQDFVARFAISDAGQALAVLYSGHIHGYSTMMASWTCVYAPNWQKDADKHGVALGALSTLQRTAQRTAATASHTSYSSYAGMALEERRQRTIAHLEAQLAATALFGTAAEYRHYAKLYVRELSELLYEKKLTEFTNALMGPIHHSLTPNASWDPFIHGVPKRDILEDVLPEMLRPELQRLISIIKENLHNAKTLPVAQRLRSPPPATNAPPKLTSPIPMPAHVALAVMNSTPKITTPSPSHTTLSANAQAARLAAMLAASAQSTPTRPASNHSMDVDVSFLSAPGPTVPPAKRRGRPPKPKEPISTVIPSSDEQSQDSTGSFLQRTGSGTVRARGPKS